jgi:hypothetical protein
VTSFKSDEEFFQTTARWMDEVKVESAFARHSTTSGISGRSAAFGAQQLWRSSQTSSVSPSGLLGLSPRKRTVGTWYSCLRWGKGCSPRYSELVKLGISFTERSRTCEYFNSHHRKSVDVRFLAEFAAQGCWLKQLRCHPPTTLSTTYKGFVEIVVGQGRL